MIVSVIEFIIVALLCCVTSVLIFDRIGDKIKTGTQHSLYCCGNCKHYGCNSHHCELKGDFRACNSVCKYYAMDNMTLNDRKVKGELL